MSAGVPDAHFVREPCFDRADGDGAGGDEGDISAAGGAGILHEGDGVELDDAGGEGAVFGGGGRGI